MDDEIVILQMNFPGNEKPRAKPRRTRRGEADPSTQMWHILLKSKLMLDGKREDCATQLLNGKVQQ
jgi:hypothetical protein